MHVLLSVLLGCTSTPETPSETAHTGAPDTDTGSTETGIVLPTEEGGHVVQLPHAGGERSAYVLVPPGFDPSAGGPVLLMFHGSGGEAQDFAQKRPTLRERARDNRWPMIFPQGLDNSADTSSWNWADPPVEPEWPAQPPDDLGFITAVLDAAVEQWSVESDQVFVAGFSKGGRMAQQLAAHAPERVAAVALGSTSFAAPFTDQPQLFSTTPPTQAVPTWMVHGLADTSLPYEGREDLPAYSEQIERWRVANGCTTELTVSNPIPRVRIERYDSCSGAPLVAGHVAELEHSWLDADDGWGWDNSTAAMDFFEAQLGR